MGLTVRLLVVPARPSGPFLVHVRRALLQDAEPADGRVSRRAEVAARTELRRLAPMLRSFVESVAAWRSDVLRYAATLGGQPPAWVRELR